MLHNDFSTNTPCWYPDEYKNDIYLHLKCVEKEERIFLKRSPQFHHRQRLINWLRRVACEVNFCRVSLHLAVFLLDYFMDSHSIKPEKLTMVATLCLVISGKFQERNANVPKINDINMILRGKYTKADVIYMEEMILNYFKWNLSVPMPVHFLELYLDYAVISTDVCQNCCTYSHVHEMVKQAANDFIDLTLEDSKFIPFVPSLVAASCIAAVRKTFNLFPLWPEILQKKTGYCEDQLHGCMSHLLEIQEKCNHHRKRKLEESPDQGYGTDQNSPNKCYLKLRKV